MCIIFINILSTVSFDIFMGHDVEAKGRRVSETRVLAKKDPARHDDKRPSDVGH